jgi:hypothetical protein
MIATREMRAHRRDVVLHHGCRAGREAQADGVTVLAHACPRIDSERGAMFHTGTVDALGSGTLAAPSRVKRTRTKSCSRRAY